MGEQVLSGAQKPDRVRQLRMPIKRRLVRPLGMDGKHERFSQRLKSMDPQTTVLGPRSLDDAQEFPPKFQLLPWSSLKADEKVNRQEAPPETSSGRILPASGKNTGAISRRF
jgi:hypothetical protein